VGFPITNLAKLMPNPAVNTDAHRRAFGQAVVAGYLARWAA